MPPRREGSNSPLAAAPTAAPVVSSGPAATATAAPVVRSGPAATTTAAPVSTPNPLGSQAARDALSSSRTVRSGPDQSPPPGRLPTTANPLSVVRHHGRGARVAASDPTEGGQSGPDQVSPLMAGGGRMAGSFRKRSGPGLRGEGAGPVTARHDGHASSRYQQRQQQLAPFFVSDNPLQLQLRGPQAAGSVVRAGSVKLGLGAPSPRPAPRPRPARAAAAVPAAAVRPPAPFARTAEPIRLDLAHARLDRVPSAGSLQTSPHMQRQPRPQDSDSALAEPDLTSVAPGLATPHRATLSPAATGSASPVSSSSARALPQSPVTVAAATAEPAHQPALEMRHVSSPAVPYRPLPETQRMLDELAALLAGHRARRAGEGSSPAPPTTE
jgi:hypothetical protein